MFTVALPMASALSYTLLGVGLALCLLGVGFAAFFWWEGRQVHAEGFDDDRTAVDTGVFLLYYVDEQELKSIAAQRGVLPDPSHLEKGRSDSIVWDGARSGRRWKFGRRSHRGSTESEAYELPADLGSLLRRVLRRLANDFELERNLETIPMVGLDRNPLAGDRADAESFLNERLAELQPDGAHESHERFISLVLDNLAQYGLQEMIRIKRFEYASVSDHHFLLVESDWKVASTGNDKTTLKLHSLIGQPEYEVAGRTIPVPKGLEILVQVPTGSLTRTGSETLTDGKVLALGVFGMIGHKEEGYIEVTPVAMFRRMAGGVQSNPYVPHGC